MFELKLYTEKKGTGIVVGRVMNEGELVKEVQTLPHRHSSTSDCLFLICEALIEELQKLNFLKDQSLC